MKIRVFLQCFFRTVAVRHKTRSYAVSVACIASDHSLSLCLSASRPLSYSPQKEALLCRPSPSSPAPLSGLPLSPRFPPSHSVTTINPNSVSNIRCTRTQLPRYVGMLIKSFQVFYYIFLVVPSLDFMLEVKSSQKLMVHISPYGSHIKWL